MSNVSSATAQRYARIAGILLLLSALGGGFGEAYVPSKLIVAADAAATAKNIHDLNWLYRLSFAGYLMEAVCDIALSLVFYVLLRPVNKYVSLLAAFFGLVSTTLFAVAEMFYFAPPLLLRDAPYLKTFSPDQLNTLALLSLKFYGYGAAFFLAFYGIATLIRGYLIFQSEYLPKFLGALLIVAGLGFVIKNFLQVLAPAYASDFFLLPVLRESTRRSGKRERPTSRLSAAKHKLRKLRVNVDEPRRDACREHRIMHPDDSRCVSRRIRERG